ncbi:MAG: NAD(P)/FAD-dependent oxidoreductase [Deltaproteobacteria bacterium]|nr:MAG: NAD(P)/FAD-dependent oxidoreductase [Deltaproteobacteria bacterium]
MEDKYDVLVVGAGPAGSAAARKCVNGGLKTLLIDKKKLPRRKACSGIIANLSQNYVLENFGPIPESVFGKPYISRGMAFHFPSVGTFFADVDCYMLYVWRDKFDHFLAKTSGAELQDETRFVSLEQKADGVEVTCEQNKSEVKLNVQYVIGADGFNSHVIRNFAPDVYEGLPWAHGVQKYYEGKVDADDRYLYWFLVRGMGPFPWLNIKDDQIIVGLACPVGQNFRAMFNNFLEYLKKNHGLTIKRELATEGCIVNTMTPLNRFFPGRGRVLMAGDSMGLMHQGDEGISCALASGGYAGEAVIQGINKGANTLALYKKLVKPEMETALDQFNPFRMRATAASTSVRQPSMFKGHSFRIKIKALKDAWEFVKSEMVMEGMLPAILKNTARRQILRKYKIPAAE